MVYKSVEGRRDYLNSRSLIDRLKKTAYVRAGTPVTGNLILTVPNLSFVLGTNVAQKICQGIIAPRGTHATSYVTR